MGVLLLTHLMKITRVQSCSTEQSVLIGGIIADTVPVSLAKYIDLEFELSITPRIEICVV